MLGWPNLNTAGLLFDADEPMGAADARGEENGAALELRPGAGRPAGAAVLAALFAGTPKVRGPLVLGAADNVGRPDLRGSVLVAAGGTPNAKPPCGALPVKEKSPVDCFFSASLFTSVCAGIPNRGAGLVLAAVEDGTPKLKPPWLPLTAAPKEKPPAGFVCSSGSEDAEDEGTPNLMALLGCGFTSSFPARQWISSFDVPQDCPHARSCHFTGCPTNCCNVCSMHILRNIGDPLKYHLLFLNRLTSQVLCEGIGQWSSKIGDFVLSLVKFTMMYSWEKITDQMHGEYPLINKMPDYKDDSSKTIW